MICANYSTFRYQFADRKLSAPDAGMTFVAGPPSTIERASGSFLSEGVATGMWSAPRYTSSNNNARLYISAVGATLITFDASGATLTAEGASAGQQLQSYFLAEDMWEEWPGPFSRTSDLVRSGGFTGGISVGVAIPGQLSISFNAIHFTVNAFAADTVPSTDEYDWYLSQQTDDPAALLITASAYNPLPPATHSGSITLTRSAAWDDYFQAIGDPLSAVEEARRFFRRSHLYVRRRSDGAIQWTNLHDALGL